MKADVWWVVGGALAVFLTVLGILVDRYLLAVYWWPLVGTEWRYERAGREWTPLEPVPGYLEAVRAGVPTGAALLGVGPDWMLDETERGDDEWVDQLHVINLDAHRDRPIAQLTHYEVEAVIRDMGVPEWVPQRYRTAA